MFVDTKPRTIINKNQVTSNRIVLSNLGKFLIGYVTAAFCWFPYLVIQSKRKILHKYDWRHPSSDARGLILYWGNEGNPFRDVTGQSET